jgi:hypothetical protein
LTCNPVAHWPEAQRVKRLDGMGAAGGRREGGGAGGGRGRPPRRRRATALTPRVKHRRRHDLRWFAHGAACRRTLWCTGRARSPPGRGRTPVVQSQPCLIAFSRHPPAVWDHVAAICPAALESSHCSAGPPLRCSRARPPPRCRGRRRSRRRRRRPRVRESALAFNTASAGIRSPSPCRHSPQTTSCNGSTTAACTTPHDRAAATARAVPSGGCRAGVAAADLAPGLMREPRIFDIGVDQSVERDLNEQFEIELAQQQKRVARPFGAFIPVRRTVTSGRRLPVLRSALTRWRRGIPSPGMRMRPARPARPPARPDPPPARAPSSRAATPAGMRQVTDGRCASRVIG